MPDIAPPESRSRRWSPFAQAAPVLPPDRPAHASDGGDDGGDGGGTATGWWRWLLLGLLGAWVATFVLPGTFTWVLAALPHEMGHATIGCLLGRPSAPSISLAGHAWTCHGDRQGWVVALLALASAGAAALPTLGWRARAALGAAAVGLPLLAYAGAAEALIVAGGHLGELAFATYCFRLCVVGGPSGRTGERIAGAMAGALLQAIDLRLFAGLVGSAEAREVYANNGSLGLKNDLLVLAEDLMGCRLERVAALFFALALLPLPLGLLLGWWRARRGDDVT